MSKIDAITVKITVHIPVDRNRRASVEDAYDKAEGLIQDAQKIGFFSTDPDLRIDRVTAPEPPSDGLEVPKNLRRSKPTDAQMAS